MNIFTPFAVIAGVVVIVILMWSDPNIKSEKEEADYQIKFRSVVIPDSLYFAGEPVPLDRFDIREALDRELLVNAYFHSQTLRLIKLDPRYFSVIEPLLKEKGVPEDFKYQAVADS